MHNGKSFYTNQSIETLKKVINDVELSTCLHLIWIIMDPKRKIWSEKEAESFMGKCEFTRGVAYFL